MNKYESLLEYLKYILIIWHVYCKTLNLVVYIMNSYILLIHDRMRLLIKKIYSYSVFFILRNIIYVCVTTCYDSVK